MVMPLLFIIVHQIWYSFESPAQLSNPRPYALTQLRVLLQKLCEEACETRRNHLFQILQSGIQCAANPLGA